MLTTLLLLQADYAYVPYSSLESVIEQSKETYYLALRKIQGTIRTNAPVWPYQVRDARHYWKIRSETMNTMTYKDFAARVEYSEEDGYFVGHIAGIRDVIGFHGETVEIGRAHV